jgi:peptidoglycan hydrolase-like protein with peptidoglycan-binding domain
VTTQLNRRFVLGALAAASLATPLWQDTAHAATRKKKRKKARRSNYTPMPREALDQGEPFHLVVSIREQKAHVYAGTQLIGSSRISSGKPGHDTPQGIFTVMEKRRHHRSNIYSNAPMPYMQRLTWSGIALHEGHIPNRPASHGCIRLPRNFAADLFSMKTRNRHVIVADHMPQVHAVSSPYLLQPRLPETASLDPASGTDAPPGAKGAPLRIYLTRHTGKHRLERVQHMLSRLGFYNGQQDGLMGRKTWRALVDFQLSAGIKPTGVLRGQTLPILETAFGIEETPAGHLYVRQAQKPVFDMAVQLEQSHELLGTHLFSMGDPDAQSGKTGWTALTVTGDSLGGAGAALAALQRFQIPADVRTRLERMLTPHSSLAISDTGLGPETGKGTDFIVVTR